MGAYKDKKTNKWYASFNCRINETTVKRVTKRGFTTKREALEFQNNYSLTHKGDISMKFGDFVENHYLPYCESRNKRTTIESKRKLLENHILPFFSNMPLSEITSRKVIDWQDYILNKRTEKGEPMADSYKKILNTQLGMIFNFAVKHFGLKSNPMTSVDAIGSSKCKLEMNFWTLDEYQKVREKMKNDESCYAIIETLYWTGLRIGELLALTRDDINLEKGIIRINKTLTRIGKEDVVTSPKTLNSNRTVSMPTFLSEEIRNYIDKFYDSNTTSRLFDVSKFFIRNKLDKYTKEAKVKRIRIHDFRHSHVSLLINRGYSALAIGKRVGHSGSEITFRYAHLYPDSQINIATSLEKLGTS